jgi:alpha-mannosidase
MTRTLLPAAALLLWCSPPLPAAAETVVDRTVAVLDSVSSLGLNAWRMSPDLKDPRAVMGDPTKPGFDDAAWEILRLNQRVYPDSCWLRREVVLPGTILGQPVRGRIVFLVSLDDEGDLWVNGEPRGRFPWDGEFELTADAAPGQRFLIAIKAVNTGGPLRLLRAELSSEASSPLRQELRDLSLSLRVGQKLLGFDTYQTSASRRSDPGVDRSTASRGEKVRLQRLLEDCAGRLDLEALRRGDFDSFRASAAAMRKEIGPVRAYAQTFTLFFTSNAHIDAAWLWREGETVEVARNTFSSVFTMMAQRPDFTYTQSAAAYYAWMADRYPAVFENIRKRVNEGRWEITGGMWVEPDCNLPAGISWSRHLLYGKSWFRKRLGTDVTIGWNPDSFGYNRNMPMLYRNAGIDAFVTQKIGWNDTNVFPHRLFWWESPDGSRILSVFPFDYVNTLEDPFRLVDWLRQYECNTGFRKLIVLFGVGNHGGGPSLEMLSRVDRMADLDIFPRIEHGTTASYLQWLRGHDLTGLPVWRDELYLEYHQGTFTTQAAMKEFNRRGETLLANADLATALSVLYGGPARDEQLRGAWETLLFHQFHDILPGSSIREVYVDATEKLRGMERTGEAVLGEALSTLAGKVDTRAVRKGRPLIVFNGLAWDRTDLVRHRLGALDGSTYAVFDAAGTEIPSQTTGTTLEREILFVARDVPAMGLQVYDLRRVEPAAPRPPSGFGGTVGNSTFEVAFHPDSGWVRSIRDRRSGREVLSGPGNRLQLLEDRPSAWDAWNIGLTGVEYPTAFRGAEVIEQGPVRTVVRVRRDYLKPGVRRSSPTEDYPTSFFEQDVILYEGLPRIDFVTRADWWEEKTMVKVAFPVAVRDTVATFEVPYGSITRSTLMRNSIDSAKVEVPALRWADLSAEGYGVTLLNRAKYGHDVKGNVLRLSLLRSPNWPDPTADRGKHVMEYALYPHAGTWREAGSPRRAIEYNAPLLTVETGRHSGTIRARTSFFRLEPASLVLSSVKRAEDGDGWVLQWYDALGDGGDAVVTLPRAAARAHRSDFLEQKGDPIPVAGNRLSVATPRHGVVTIRVAFR